MNQIKRNYHWHSDPGHAWLRVPLTDLEAVGVIDKITPCSYVSGDCAYLEEDCDAPIFIRAATAKGWGLCLTGAPRSSFYDYCPVRQYARYSAPHALAAARRAHLAAAGRA